MVLGWVVGATHLFVCVTAILGSNMDDRGGDARSAAGHAAFSMRGVDDRWVLIQVSA